MGSDSRTLLGSHICRIQQAGRNLGEIENIKSERGPAALRSEDDDDAINLLQLCVQLGQ